jgi:hypothetical protein
VPSGKNALVTSDLLLLPVKAEAVGKSGVSVQDKVRIAVF